MKIKSIYLESFGKFQERRIDFEDGINVIYGNNESGKSTIHQFLGAVFYGFVKPNLKHTRYLDEFYDYEPMARDLYKGKVVLARRPIHSSMQKRMKTGHKRLQVEIRVWMHPEKCFSVLSIPLFRISCISLRITEILRRMIRR